MNNNGDFDNNPPVALMSYPFPMHNQQQIHPPLMAQPYINQSVDLTPRFSNPRPLMQSPKSEKRKQESLTCDTCGIEVNSQQMMDAHIQGQKHIKKMKIKTVSTAIPPTTTSSITQLFDSIDVDPKPLSTGSESATLNESNSSPVVLKKPPISSTSSEKSVLQIMNELAKFHKVTARYDLIKETGLAHCKQFEVQLSLADETYTGTGTSIKRAQQIAAEQALASTSLKNPEQKQRRLSSPRGSGIVDRGIHHQSEQSNSNQHEINLFEDLLNQKCVDISEYNGTIIALHRFVEDIERAMKIISDKMMEESKLNNIRVLPEIIEQTNEDSSESFRMLKGAMKVSILAMRLFLKNDSEYSLVLVCANKPNIALLNEISQQLSMELNTQSIELDSIEQQSTSATYQVQAYGIEACLTVKSSLLPQHIIRIMLASPVFRTEDLLSLDETTRREIAELNPDPVDMLEKNKCLEAAAEIRHSNWFTRCMLNNHYDSIVLRLLRDLQHNQTPLSFLNLWCLALLVHKCQIEATNSATTLFRAVFACLSSGILLPNPIGPGLIDPCEEDFLDASSYLTIEQRLKLTEYSQYILRLIAFEQFDKIYQY